MSQCTKRIKNKQWDGYEESWICDRPAIDNAEGLQLCVRHYKAHMLKVTPWGQRDTYRDATTADMERCRSLKLKTEHTNRLYICRGSQIWTTDGADNKYTTATSIPADPQLFCVKK